MAKARLVKTKYGIFLGNVYDPTNLKIRWPESYINDGETEFDARGRFIRWMITKTVGPPVATPKYEAIDLVEMGYVGVYFNEKAGDTIVSAETIDPTFPAGRTDVDFLSEHVWSSYKIRHEWLEDGYD